MAESTLTPEKQQQLNDKRLGIAYSTFSVLLVIGLAFGFLKLGWGPAIAESVSKVPAIVGSLASGKGMPLSDEESKEVLSEGYEIIADYATKLGTYTERFDAEYLADNETRERLRADLQTQVDALNSSECGLYWMKPDSQPVSEPYEETLANLNACRNDLAQYFDMLVQAMDISLEYVEPFQQEEIDKIWEPINDAADKDGQNKYIAEFNELYPNSNPKDVKADDSAE